MKTNVTCSLDSGLVDRLDAFRAPMGIGRSAALELLLEALPEVQAESPGDQVRLYFDSNGNQVEPGVHHDNPKFDMVAPAKVDPVELAELVEAPLLATGSLISPEVAPASEPTASRTPQSPSTEPSHDEKKGSRSHKPSPSGKK